MNLDRCSLNPDSLVGSSPISSVPDHEWSERHARKSIPDALFRLYVKAGFLSFNAAPSYLQDDRRLLFSFFCNCMHALCDLLDEAEESRGQITQNYPKRYSPIKKARGVIWDTKADASVRRGFRQHLIALASSLDVFSELTALLLTKQIPDLALGRASFGPILKWLRDPTSAMMSSLVSPQRGLVDLLHNQLRPLVVRSGPDAEWLELFMLYRNKEAHFGSTHFPEISLHDSTGEFYAFLPRVWPFHHQEFLSSPDSPGGPTGMTEEAMIRDNFVEVDLLEYTLGLWTRIEVLLEKGLSVLLQAYDILRSGASNAQALAQLLANSRRLAFKRF